jgi:shikimate kinase
MQKKKNNIVLIGMAGAGKSSVGTALAKNLRLRFVDVDTLIEEDQKAPLQQVLNNHGVAGFRKLEEKVILTMEQQGHVIATGGSAIYSEPGMAYLKRSSILVLLDVPLPILQQRVGNFGSRGLVKTKGQSFEQLFEERLPLYQKHADFIISCDKKSIDAICQLIKEQITDSFYHL